MKTMNYLLIIAFIFTIGSCSKETAVQNVENEKLAAVEYRGRIDQEKEKRPEVFELDLRRFNTIQNILKLESEKTKLNRKIELGNRNLLPELNRITGQISLSDEILKGLNQAICSEIERKIKDLEEKSFLRALQSQELSRLRKQQAENCNNTNNKLVTRNDMLFVKAGPVKGACNDPGRALIGGCKYPVEAGGILVKMEEKRFAGQIILKNEIGKTVSKGKVMVGPNGGSQVFLDVPASLGYGSIVIVDDRSTTEIPVKTMN